MEKNLKIEVTYKDIHNYFLNRAKGCAEYNHLQWLSSFMSVDVKVHAAGLVGTTNAYVTNISKHGTITIVKDAWSNLRKEDNESKLAMQIQWLKDSGFNMSLPVNITFIDKFSGTTHEDRTLNWDNEHPRTMFVK